MLKKLTASLLTVLLLMTSLPLTALAEDDVPARIFLQLTENYEPTVVNDVVEIRTPEDLYYVNRYMDGSFRLMNDIDLSAYNWIPFGCEDELTDFTGTFDGNGFAIQNLYTKSSFGSYRFNVLGLFGQNAGTIKNLTLEGTVESDASVMYIGSFAGYNKGSIDCCASKCDLNNKNSSANKSTTYIGGIAGYSGEKTKITQSYFAGNIRTVQSFKTKIAAGITSGYANIANCYVTGDIIGADESFFVSCGISYGSCEVRCCYTIGKSKHPDGNGTYVYCLSECTDEVIQSGALTRFELKRSYLIDGFDFKKTWLIDSDCGYPYPQLRRNLQVKEAQADPEYKPIENNSKYEIHTVEDLFYIHKKPNVPYILMEDIDLSEWTAANGEIDWYENGWKPIDLENTFDGNGHTIKGMRIEVNNASQSDPYGYAVSYAGLFGNNNGTIKNLTVEGEITINKPTHYIGGIAAYSNDVSKVINCQNHCNITANYSGGSSSYFGGIVGYCYPFHTEISQCVNNGAISVRQTGYFENISTKHVYVSGITYGCETLQDCYNTGNLSASNEDDTADCISAGIDAAKSDNMQEYTWQHCYNIGTADYAVAGDGLQVQECYYLDGCGEGCSGAAALSNEQMQSMESFAGFSETLWTILPDSDYPYPQLILKGGAVYINALELTEPTETMRLMVIPNYDKNYGTAKVNILPKGATGDPTVTWTSSDETVVRIDNVTHDYFNYTSSARVYPVSQGKATVTASLSNGVSTSFEVETIQTISAFETEDVIEMLVGETYPFEVKTVPEGALEPYSVYSKNESIVTIDENGALVAHRDGNTTVTIVTDRGTATKTVPVKVYRSVPSQPDWLKLNSDIRDYFIGESTSIYTTYPLGVINPLETLSVHSSDTSVMTATLSEYNNYEVDLQFVGVGTADLCFTTNRGFFMSTTFTVSDDPNDLEVELSDPQTEYNFKEQYPQLELKYHDRRMQYKSVQYYDNLNVGTARGVISLFNTDITKAFSFEIVPLDAQKITLTVDEDYLGSGETADVSLSYDKSYPKIILEEGKDYTKRIVPVQDSDDVKLIVEFDDNINGTLETIIPFHPYEILDNMVSFDYGSLNTSGIGINHFCFYDGNEHKEITATVRDGEKELVEGVDYQLSYTPCRDVGNVYVFVRGIGHYQGSVIADFTILATDIKDLDITQTHQIIYNGKTQDPPIQISQNNRQLIEGQDYDIACNDNINVGSVPFTITGKGNYTGSVSSSFVILPKPVSELTIRRSEETYQYDGTEKRPSVTVFDGKDELISGMDYEVSYADNINAGTGSVIIKGLRNYGGTATAEFPIKPLDLSRCTVSLPDNPFYSDGTEQKPKVTVKDGEKTLTETVDYTLSYRNNIAEGNAAVIVTGAGNYTGSLSREFTILPKPKTELSTCTFTLDNYIFNYDGTEKRPEVNGKDGVNILHENEDYTLRYSDNTEIGTAAVLLSGIGRYSGTLSIPFIIREDGGEFVWDRDNWRFPNTAPTHFSKLSYGDQMGEEYLQELKNNLTNSEYQIVFNSEWFGDAWIDQPWEGACYGMSVTTLLAKEGYMPFEKYGENAQNLHDLSAPVQNKDVSSLINYYQMLQIKSVIQQQYRTVPNRTNEENIRELISLLKDHRGVLVGFKKNGWGSHTVLAIGYESGSFTRDGVTYQGCIRVCDPNRADRYDENYNIYFNSETYNWCIPAYAGMRSSEGARFNYIGADINEINMGGFLSGTTGTEIENYIARIDALSIGNNRSVAKVAEKDGSYMTQNHAPGDIVEDIEYISGGESKGRTGYNLLDGDSAYRITQATPQEMKVSMDYDNCYMTAGSAAGKSVIFDKAGSVSIESEAADYSISMSFNENYATDWFAIKVTGTDASNVTLKSSGDGYVLSADALNRVEISANNRTASAKATFSADTDSVYIYEIDERTIGVRVDADHNGTYETDLPADVNTHTALIGDVNSDGKVDVTDATLLQMYLAEVEELSAAQLEVADTNGDGKVDVTDATAIQNFIAELIDHLGA